MLLLLVSVVIMVVVIMKRDFERLQAICVCELPRDKVARSGDR